MSRWTKRRKHERVARMIKVMSWVRKLPLDRQRVIKTFLSREVELSALDKLKLLEYSMVSDRE